MKVGSRTLASYQYGPNNGLLLSQTYGNGDIVAFTYDPPCRVKITTCSERHLPAPIPQPRIRRCVGTYQAKRKINSTIPSGMVLFPCLQNLHPPDTIPEKRKIRPFPANFDFSCHPITRLEHTYIN